MIRLLNFCAGAALACVAVPAQAATYGITDIGAFGNFGVTVTDMNNSGQVVGHSYDGTGNAAFLYSGGTMSNLRPLVAPFGVSAGGSLAVTHSYATGINNAGQVVGWAALTDPSVAFLYSGGVMSDLGYLGPSPFNVGGLYPAKPQGINASGQAVSDSVYNGLYNPGTGWTDLGGYIHLGGAQFNPAAINDSGAAGGYLDYIAYHAAAIRSADGTVMTLTGPSSFGGAGSYIHEMNNVGEAVGSARTSGNLYTHGFFYSGGTVTDIGSLVAGGLGYSLAEGINGLGQVVGTSDRASPAPVGSPCVGQGYRAVLYSGGALVDVNTMIDPTAGWCLTSANAINDSGQIAGTGINALGQVHAYLLTPSSPVPVPAAVWLLGSGLLGLIGVGRRRT